MSLFDSNLRPEAGISSMDEYISKVHNSILEMADGSCLSMIQSLGFSALLPLQTIQANLQRRKGLIANTSGNIFSTTRMIFGGANDLVSFEKRVPKVRAELVPLYIRLPLFVRFYKQLLQDDSTADGERGVFLIISNESVYKNLFDLLDTKTMSSTERSIEMAVIEECNRIAASMPGKSPHDMINAFIDEVNRSFGILNSKTFKDHQKMLRDKVSGHTEFSEPQIAESLHFDFADDDLKLEGERPLSELPLPTSSAPLMIDRASTSESDLFSAPEAFKVINKFYDKIRKYADRTYDPQNDLFSERIQEIRARVALETNDAARYQAFREEVARLYSADSVEDPLILESLINELVLLPTAIAKLLLQMSYITYFGVSFSPEAREAVVIRGVDNLPAPSLSRSDQLARIDSQTIENSKLFTLNEPTPGHNVSDEAAGSIPEDQTVAPKVVAIRSVPKLNDATVDDVSKTQARIPLIVDVKTLSEAAMAFYADARPNVGDINYINIGYQGSIHYPESFVHVWDNEKYASLTDAVININFNPENNGLSKYLAAKTPATNAISYDAKTSKFVAGAAPAAASKIVDGAFDVFTQPLVFPLAINADKMTPDQLRRVFGVILGFLPRQGNIKSIDDLKSAANAYRKALEGAKIRRIKFSSKTSDSLVSAIAQYFANPSGSNRMIVGGRIDSVGYSQEERLELLKGQFAAELCELDRSTTTVVVNDKRLIDMADNLLEGAHSMLQSISSGKPYSSLFIRAEKQIAKGRRMSSTITTKSSEGHLNINNMLSTMDDTLYNKSFGVSSAKPQENPLCRYFAASGPFEEPSISSPAFLGSKAVTVPYVSPYLAPHAGTITMINHFIFSVLNMFREGKSLPFSLISALSFLTDIPAEMRIEDNEHSSRNVSQRGVVAESLIDLIRIVRDRTDAATRLSMFQKNNDEQFRETLSHNFDQIKTRLAIFDRELDLANSVITMSRSPTSRIPEFRSNQVYFAKELVQRLRSAFDGFGIQNQPPRVSLDCPPSILCKSLFLEEYASPEVAAAMSAMGTKLALVRESMVELKAEFNNLYSAFIATFRLPQSGVLSFKQLINNNLMDSSFLYSGKANNFGKPQNFAFIEARMSMLINEIMTTCTSAMDSIMSCVGVGSGHKSPLRFASSIQMGVLYAQACRLSELINDQRPYLTSANPGSRDISRISLHRLIEGHMSRINDVNRREPRPDTLSNNVTNSHTYLYGSAAMSFANLICAISGVLFDYPIIPILDVDSCDQMIRYHEVVNNPKTGSVTIDANTVYYHRMLVAFESVLSVQKLNGYARRITPTTSFSSNGLQYTFTKSDGISDDFFIPCSSVEYPEFASGELSIGNLNTAYSFNANGASLIVPRYIFKYPSETVLRPGYFPPGFENNEPGRYDTSSFKYHTNLQNKYQFTTTLTDFAQFLRDFVVTTGDKRNKMVSSDENFVIALGRLNQAINHSNDKVADFMPFALYVLEKGMKELSNIVSTQQSQSTFVGGNDVSSEIVINTENFTFNHPVFLPVSDQIGGTYQYKHMFEFFKLAGVTELIGGEGTLDEFMNQSELWLDKCSKNYQDNTLPKKPKTIHKVTRQMFENDIIQGQIVQASKTLDQFINPAYVVPVHYPVASSLADKIGLKVAHEVMLDDICSPLLLLQSYVNQDYALSFLFPAFAPKDSNKFPFEHLNADSTPSSSGSLPDAPCLTTIDPIFKTLALVDYPVTNPVIFDQIIPVNSCFPVLEGLPTISLSRPYSLGMWDSILPISVPHRSFTTLSKYQEYCQLRKRALGQKVPITLEAPMLVPEPVTADSWEKANTSIDALWKSAIGSSIRIDPFWVSASGITKKNAMKEFYRFLNPDCNCISSEDITSIDFLISFLQLFPDSSSLKVPPIVSPPKTSQDRAQNSANEFGGFLLGDYLDLFGENDRSSPTKPFNDLVDHVVGSLDRKIGKSEGFGSAFDRYVKSTNPSFTDFKSFVKGSLEQIEIFKSGTGASPSSSSGSSSSSSSSSTTSPSLTINLTSVIECSLKIFNLVVNYVTHQVKHINNSSWKTKLLSIFEETPEGIKVNFLSLFDNWDVTIDQFISPTVVNCDQKVFIGDSIVRHRIDENYHLARSCRAIELSCVYCPTTIAAINKREKIIGMLDSCSKIRTDKFEIINVSNVVSVSLYSLKNMQVNDQYPTFDKVTLSSVNYASGEFILDTGSNPTKNKVNNPYSSFNVIPNNVVAKMDSSKTGFYQSRVSLAPFEYLPAFVGGLKTPIVVPKQPPFTSSLSGINVGVGEYTPLYLAIRTDFGSLPPTLVAKTKMSLTTVKINPKAEGPFDKLIIMVGQWHSNCGNNVIDYSAGLINFALNTSLLTSSTIGTIMPIIEHDNDDVIPLLYYLVSMSLGILTAKTPGISQLSTNGANNKIGNLITQKTQIAQYLSMGKNVTFFQKLNPAYTSIFDSTVEKISSVIDLDPLGKLFASSPGAVSPHEIMHSLGLALSLAFGGGAYIPPKNQAKIAKPEYLIVKCKTLTKNSYKGLLQIMQNVASYLPRLNSVNSSIENTGVPSVIVSRYLSKAPTMTSKLVIQINRLISEYISSGVEVSKINQLELLKKTIIELSPKQNLMSMYSHAKMPNGAKHSTVSIARSAELYLESQDLNVKDSPLYSKNQFEQSVGVPCELLELLDQFDFADTFKNLNIKMSEIDTSIRHTMLRASDTLFNDVSLDISQSALINKTNSTMNSLTTGKSAKAGNVLNAGEYETATVVGAVPNEWFIQDVYKMTQVSEGDRVMGFYAVPFAKESMQNIKFDISIDSPTKGGKIPQNQFVDPTTYSMFLPLLAMFNENTSIKRKNQLLTTDIIYALSKIQDIGVLLNNFKASNETVPVTDDNNANFRSVTIKNFSSNLKDTIFRVYFGKTIDNMMTNVHKNIRELVNTTTKNNGTVYFLNNSETLFEFTNPSPSSDTESPNARAYELALTIIYEVCDLISYLEQKLGPDEFNVFFKKYTPGADDMISLIPNKKEVLDTLERLTHLNTENSMGKYPVINNDNAVTDAVFKNVSDNIPNEVTKQGKELLKYALLSTGHNQKFALVENTFEILAPEPCFESPLMNDVWLSKSNENRVLDNMKKPKLCLQIGNINNDLKDYSHTELTKSDTSEKTEKDQLNKDSRGNDINTVSRVLDLHGNFILSGNSFEDAGKLPSEYFSNSLVWLEIIMQFVESTGRNMSKTINRIAELQSAIRLYEDKAVEPQAKVEIDIPVVECIQTGSKLEESFLTTTKDTVLQRKPPIDLYDHTTVDTVEYCRNFYHQLTPETVYLRDTLLSGGGSAYQTSMITGISNYVGEVVQKKFGEQKFADLKAAQDGHTVDLMDIATYHICELLGRVDILSKRKNETTGEFSKDTFGDDPIQKGNDTYEALMYFEDLARVPVTVDLFEKVYPVKRSAILNPIERMFSTNSTIRRKAYEATKVKDDISTFNFNYESPLRVSYVKLFEASKSKDYEFETLTDRVPIDVDIYTQLLFNNGLPLEPIRVSDSVVRIGDPNAKEPVRTFAKESSVTRKTITKLSFNQLSGIVMFPNGPTIPMATFDAMVSEKETLELKVLTQLFLNSGPSFTDIDHRLINMHKSVISTSNTFNTMKRLPKVMSDNSFMYEKRFNNLQPDVPFLPLRLNDEDYEILSFKTVGLPVVNYASTDFVHDSAQLVLSNGTSFGHKIEKHRVLHKSHHVSMAINEAIFNERSFLKLKDNIIRISKVATNIIKNDYSAIAEAFNISIQSKDYVDIKATNKGFITLLTKIISNMVGKGLPISQLNLIKELRQALQPFKYQRVNEFSLDNSYVNRVPKGILIDSCTEIKRVAYTPKNVVNLISFLVQHSANTYENVRTVTEFLMEPGLKKFNNLLYPETEYAIPVVRLLRQQYDLFKPINPISATDMMLASWGSKQVTDIKDATLQNDLPKMVNGSNSERRKIITVVASTVPGGTPTKQFTDYSSTDLNKDDITKGLILSTVWADYLLTDSYTKEELIKVFTITEDTKKEIWTKSNLIDYQSVKRCLEGKYFSLGDAKLLIDVITLFYHSQTNVSGGALALDDDLYMYKKVKISQENDEIKRREGKGIDPELGKKMLKIHRERKYLNIDLLKFINQLPELMYLADSLYLALLGSKYVKDALSSSVQGKFAKLFGVETTLLAKLLSENLENVFDESLQDKEMYSDYIIDATKFSSSPFKINSVMNFYPNASISSVKPIYHRMFDFYKELYQSESIIADDLLIRFAIFELISLHIEKGGSNWANVSIDLTGSPTISGATKPVGNVDWKTALASPDPVMLSRFGSKHNSTNTVNFCISKALFGNEPADKIKEILSKGQINYDLNSNTITNKQYANAPEFTITDVNMTEQDLEEKLLDSMMKLGNLVSVLNLTESKTMEKVNTLVKRISEANNHGILTEIDPGKTREKTSDKEIKAHLIGNEKIQIESLNNGTANDSWEALEDQLWYLAVLYPTKKTDKILSNHEGLTQTNNYLGDSRLVVHRNNLGPYFNAKVLLNGKIEYYIPRGLMDVKGGHYGFTSTFVRTLRTLTSMMVPSTYDLDPEGYLHKVITEVQDAQGIEEIEPMIQTLINNKLSRGEYDLIAERLLKYYESSREAFNEDFTTAGALVAMFFFNYKSMDKAVEAAFVGGGLAPKYNPLDRIMGLYFMEGKKNAPEITRAIPFTRSIVRMLDATLEHLETSRVVINLSNTIANMASIPKAEAFLIVDYIVSFFDVPLNASVLLNKSMDFIVGKLEELNNDRRALEKIVVLASYAGDPKRNTRDADQNADVGRDLDMLNLSGENKKSFEALQRQIKDLKDLLGPLTKPGKTSISVRTILAPNQGELDEYLTANRENRWLTDKFGKYIMQGLTTDMTWIDSKIKSFKGSLSATEAHKILGQTFAGLRALFKSNLVAARSVRRYGLSKKMAVKEFNILGEPLPKLKSAITITRRLPYRVFLSATGVDRNSQLAQLRENDPVTQNVYSFGRLPVNLNHIANDVPFSPMMLASIYLEQIVKDQIAAGSFDEVTALLQDNEFAKVGEAGNAGIATLEIVKALLRPSEVTPGATIDVIYNDLANSDTIVSRTNADGLKKMLTDYGLGAKTLRELNPIEGPAVYADFMNKLIKAILIREAFIAREEPGVILNRMVKEASNFMF